MERMLGTKGTKYSDASSLLACALVLFSDENEEEEKMEMGKGGNVCMAWNYEEVDHEWIADISTDELLEDGSDWEQGTKQSCNEGSNGLQEESMDGMIEDSDVEFYNRVRCAVPFEVFSDAFDTEDGDDENGLDAGVEEDEDQRWNDSVNKTTSSYDGSSMEMLCDDDVSSVVLNEGSSSGDEEDEGEMGIVPEKSVQMGVGVIDLTVSDAESGSEFADGESVSEEDDEEEIVWGGAASKKDIKQIKKMVSTGRGVVLWR